MNDNGSVGERATSGVSDRDDDSVSDSRSDRVHGPRKLSRAVAAIAIAVSGSAFVSGCGVQPTGLNIAQMRPIDAGTSSSSQSTLPSQGTHPVWLFLFSKINKGPGSMVVRLVASGTTPGPMDLPALIAQGSPYADDGQYTSYVPAGITLKETTSRHQYVISSPSPLSPLAVQQLACTFDQYWLANPDPNRTVGPTTYFIGKGLDTGWQDCTGGLVVPDGAANGTVPPAKATGPEGVKSTTVG